MRSSKWLLASLIIALFSFTSTCAAMNNQAILPDKIPKTITFHPEQAHGNVASFSFPTSALPAKFLCYFNNPENGKKPAGIIIHIDSSEDNIEFLPGTSAFMKTEENDVKMFTITSAINRNPIGHVFFTLNNDDVNDAVITITCTMYQ